MPPKPPPKIFHGLPVPVDKFEHEVEVDPRTRESRRSGSSPAASRFRSRGNKSRLPLASSGEIHSRALSAALAVAFSIAVPDRIAATSASKVATISRAVAGTWELPQLVRSPLSIFSRRTEAP